MRLPSLLVLACAALLSASSLGAQGKSSPPILPGSEPLWTSLNEIALTLPDSYDLFLASLSGQISSLQASNESLQDSVTSLQNSNSSLTLRNADLQNSLQISQEAVATSENKSALLQKDLDDSMQSTTRAEADAKALALEVGVLKIGCVTLGVGLGAVAVYEGGHALKWW